MKDGYDIFERGGATCLRVWGRDEKDLFSRALLGLAAVVRPDVSPPGGEETRIRVHVHGEDLGETLERFLSQVVFENEMHDAVFSAMDIIFFSHQEIECELIGRKIEHTEEHVLNLHVGRHGIERKDGQYQTEIVCDVL